MFKSVIFDMDEVLVNRSRFIFGCIGIFREQGIELDYDYYAPSKSGSTTEHLREYCGIEGTALISASRRTGHGSGAQAAIIREKKMATGKSPGIRQMILDLRAHGVKLAWHLLPIMI